MLKFFLLMGITFICAATVILLAFIASMNDESINTIMCNRLKLKNEKVRLELERDRVCLEIVKEKTKQIELSRSNFSQDLK